MSYAEAQYTVDEVLDGVKKIQIAGNEPTNLKDIKIIPGNNHLYLSWVPQDTAIDGMVLTTVTGVIIRRKEGDYPVDENDGDFVGDFTGPDLYRYVSQPYVDEGLTNGVEYFYRFFPYSGYGMMNRSFENRASGIPEKTTVWGFHQDFMNMDPETTITYIESAENYTPMMTNIDAGTHTYGSWENWEWFKKVKPYLVDTKRAAWGAMVETDVSLRYTQSGDGSTDDVSWSTIAVDAFAWLPKIYMKEVYAEDGNSRDVYFALHCNGDCADYIPVGFYNKQGVELEGLWIPMYYPTHKSSTFRVLANQPLNSHSANGSEYMTTISSRWGENGVAFGGPITNVIRDLLYMLYKSTNIQDKAGYGYSYRTNTLSVTAENLNLPTYGKAYKANYGRGSSETSTPNRIFYSHVLGAYGPTIIDPYTIFKKGTLNMCKNYEYTPSTPDNYTTFSQFYYTTSHIFPKRLKYLGDGFGSMPVMNDISSGTTGLCDSVYANTSLDVAVAGRFGSYRQKQQAGPGWVVATLDGWGTDLDRTEQLVVPMLLPDPGYAPDYDSMK